MKIFLRKLRRKLYDMGLLKVKLPWNMSNPSCERCDKEMKWTRTRKGNPAYAYFYCPECKDLPEHISFRNEVQAHMILDLVDGDYSRFGYYTEEEKKKREEGKEK